MEEKIKKVAFKPVWQTPSGKNQVLVRKMSFLNDVDNMTKYGANAT